MTPLNAPMLKSRFCQVLIAAMLLAAPLPAQLSDTARQQIAGILQQKSSFSVGEQKMDSQLVFAARGARGLSSPSLNQIVSVEFNASGMVTVDIQAAVSDSLVAQITALGGQVIDRSDTWGMIRADMPLLAIETLATSTAVKTISRRADAVTNRVRMPVRLPAGIAGPTMSHRNSGERRALQHIVSNGTPIPASNGKRPSLGTWFVPNGLAFFIGALTSQGYVLHRANLVVGTGVNGAGVKVGVLSDSASAARIAALIATGDLPANALVLPGQAGPSNGSDEGTAMMEIVYDLAPGIQPIFATAVTSVPSFASNIIALQAAGCQVIVDDVTYFNEGAFQDGPIARAVNTVTANGAIYFSSAANSGNLTLGTSGTWEGDFVDGGAAGAPINESGRLHQFPGGLTYDILTATSSVINLKWSDALAGSSNDYDLFILDSTGAIVKGFSTNSQTGTQDPYEIVTQGTNCGTPSAKGYCPARGDRIVVLKFSGAARALRLDTNRGRLAVNTAGSTFGHNAGANTVSTAATYWNSAHTGTRPFAAFENPIEIFSSDGPRKIFYNPDGSAITPGNFLFGTNGGTTLQKPDITGADGVGVKTPGFFPFFGTSAAAPHAAAVAALVLSARPFLTRNQIYAAIINSATDQMVPGWDRDSGFGTANAQAAVQYTLTH
jgi:hypothetical protein